MSIKTPCGGRAAPGGRSASPPAAVFAAVFAAALLLLLPLAAAAQDDPFDAAAFDAATGAGPTAAAAPAAANTPGTTAAGEPALPSLAARTEYLVGGAVLVAGTGTIASGFDGYAALASASGRLFGKVSVPDYGILYLSYNLSQALFEGIGGSGLPGSGFLAHPLDLSSPKYTLGELYYGFDIGKTLFLRLGKQLLAWGPSRVWSPVDFVNSARKDFFSPIDLREGRPALKLFLPLGKANALVFTDFSDAVTNGQVRDPLQSTTLAGRLDATVGGFELALSGLAGSLTQGRAGLDFSGDFFGSSLYGELALAPAYSGYESSVMASLGLSRAIGDLKRWTVSIEGLYNSRGGDLSSPELTAGLAPGGALTSLYIGRAYGYASLQAKELLSTYLSTTASAIANFSDLSYSIRLQEDLSLPRAVPFSCILAYNGGGGGREFTLLGGDNSIAITLETRIEF